MAKGNVERKRLTSRKKKCGNAGNLRKYWGAARSSNRASAEGVIEDINDTESLSNTPILLPNSSDQSTTSGPTLELPRQLQPEGIDLKGNRIINIGYLLSQLKEICSHGQRFGCTFSNLVVTQEITTGLICKYVLRCQMCLESFFLHSQKPQSNEEAVDLNTLAVKGIMSIGGGFSNLEECLGCLDIKCMAAGTYHKQHAKVSDCWQTLAAEQMKQAAKEEIRHAVEIGSIDKNGVPLIEVVVDGAWSKRSYKTKYNALSGVATIIGNHSGKVLYVGVKNKYCVQCDRNSADNLVPPPHTCTKNYTGSSTSMESEILVQGFRMSLEMHGVKYHKLIGDGDSSVYSKILESRPYVDTTVQKIECRNHLLRNYSNKLKELVANTKFNRKERKSLESRLLRLRSGVKGAICHNKSLKETNVAVKNLRTDIINGVAHVFGSHDKCADYFCKKPHDDQNIYTTLTPIFLAKIMEIVRRLANNAKSLIYDVDSNVVEHYNAIVAKFIGGKRVNYALGSSYSARCHAAVLAHNTQMPHTLFRRQFMPNNSSFSGVISRIESRRKARNSRRRLLKAKKVYRDARKPMATRRPDQDYGELCQKPDMDSDTFKIAVEEFLNNLERTEADRKELEVLTRDQDDDIWMEERRKLITASNFAKICKRRKNTDSSKAVQSILYRSAHLSNVPSIQHGKEHEEEARKDLELSENIEVQKCGLFVDKKYGFIGASPDGLVGEDTLVEIKCPFTAYKLNLNVEQAIATRKITFWKKNKQGETVINKSHDWYYQIQGQMHVADRKKCIFCVWVGSDMKIEYINRDAQFWNSKMEDRLKEFYSKALLPELVDPRRTRSLPLRNIFI